MGNAGKPEGRFFLCNNLPNRANYENTSFQIYGEIDPELNPEERFEKWTLPYKSTLVVPILPYGLWDEELFGYLCIDSADINYFDKDMDVKISHTVADSIYNIISDV